MWQQNTYVDEHLEMYQSKWNMSGRFIWFPSQSRLKYLSKYWVSSTTQLQRHREVTKQTAGGSVCELVVLSISLDWNFCSADEMYQ